MYLNHLVLLQKTLDNYFASKLVPSKAKWDSICLDKSTISSLLEPIGGKELFMPAILHNASTFDDLRIFHPKSNATFVEKDFSYEKKSSYVLIVNREVDIKLCD